MARRIHRPEPLELDPGDDGIGYTQAVCRVCFNDITRRYNTQKANKALEGGSDDDVLGPDYWYWTHNRRPSGDDDVESPL